MLLSSSHDGLSSEDSREMGIKVAQAVLGHRLVETTQVYAEVSQWRAIEAMERIG
ncbi:MAG: hypothetical protein AB7O97_07645 [Planctomycetota bacterium]